jgi:hypothetical protein
MSWKDRRKACEQRSKDNAPTTDGRSLNPNETKARKPCQRRQIMPNGKRMRDCTGADMKKFGDLLLKRGESLLKQAEQPKT